ncbi:flavine reductase [Tribonema minus]|uniref:Flavine reductase n=1 Tax=Tribonema minus TaxID=303371 RepID=A0A836C907_9STRA|nr:flavine reductase [Tribonema minus]
MKVTAAALVASLGPAAAFVSTSSFAPRTAQGAGVRHASPLQMSIAVFGASGLLGSEVTYQALQRGEDVIAFLRDPSKLVVPAGSGGPDAGKPLKSDKLKVVQGSVVSYDDVTKAFAGGDVTGVVVALGGKTKDVGKTMLTDGTSNIIKAMKANGVKRIAAVTSIGAGDSENQAPFFFKVLMFTVMKNIFEDKNNQEALFTRGPGSDLEFTIVRPGGLTVEPPTGVINVISGEAGSISRADVADFCLGAVLEEGFPYLRKTPCISSVGGTSWTKDRSAAARGGM